MRDITEIMSPVSYLVVLISNWPLLVVLFGLSWVEFAVLVVVDTLALFVVIVVDRRLFPHRHPRFSPIFPRLDLDAPFFSTNKGRAIAVLTAFPGVRARYGFVVSLVKVLPAWTVVLFYVEHDSYSLQVLKVLGFELMFFCVFYAISYVDLHEFISRKLRDLHERYDYTEAFAAVDTRREAEVFRSQMTLGVVASVVTILVLLWVTVYTRPAGDPGLALAVLVVAAAMFLLLGRLLMVYYQYFMGGLEAVHERLTDIDRQGTGLVLPLHSSSALALFEQTFNALLGRLRDHERELTHRVVHEADESRFHTLGEISGLVAERLAGPLQAVKEAAEAIREEGPSSSRVERLGQGAKEAMALVTTLRAFLRNPGSHASTDYREVHDYACTLLGTQFADMCEKVRVTVDPRLNDIPLAVTRLDLIYICYNLYRNSVEDFGAHGNGAPRIRVELAAQNHDHCTVAVADNGSGLETDAFARVTGDRLRSGEAGGPGLRLVRRLLERYGGGLAVDADYRKGTRFLVTLPVPAERAAS